MIWKYHDKTAEIISNNSRINKFNEFVCIFSLAYLTANKNWTSIQKSILIISIKKISVSAWNIQIIVSSSIIFKYFFRCKYSISSFMLPTVITSSKSNLSYSSEKHCNWLLKLSVWGRFSLLQNCLETVAKAQLKHQVHVYYVHFCLKILFILRL